MEGEEQRRSNKTRRSRRETMSPFEQMMLEKMDELVRVHKEDYVELKQCFESISERLDAMGAPHVNDI